MRLNKIQIKNGNVYLMQKGLIRLLILSGILLTVFFVLPFRLNLSPFSIPSLVMFFFGLLTLYIFITNLYQHFKYGGSRWGMINSDGVKITFTHSVEKENFKWDEIEKIIYARKLVSKGKYGKESYIPQVIVFLIKNEHPEKQVYDISSVKCSVDNVNSNMLHYHPESNSFYLTALFLSEDIIKDAMNWIKNFSNGKTTLVQTDLLKLDYKNNIMEIS